MAVPTERRLVTVLFGDLSDFTAWAEDLDPERVGLVADAALAAMSAAVAEVDGHVDKLTGDGIMAVFGAPVAHEDDAERAVRAALAMQQAVAAVMRQHGGGARLGLRVGLNTGEVVAGVQAQLSYTVVGDTVNTAARLSDAAEVGQIWAGRDTALATMSVASWQALPLLRLKGKREPVAAFVLVGLRPGWTATPDLVCGPGARAAAPLVGREAELGQLVTLLTDALESQSVIRVAVSGEAGVGKTRLLEELSRFALEIPGARVLWGKARPYGQQRSRAPLVDWVRTACGVSDADSPELVANRVRAAVERLADAPLMPADLADALLLMLGVAPEPGRLPESATPGARRRVEPVAAAAHLFSGLAGAGPVLLVADDLNWAGRTALGQLEQLLGAVRGPVLAVGVGRSDGPGGWRESINFSAELSLLPLDPPSSSRLLQAYLGGGELEPGARDLLLGRAQGNPFYLAELLRLLIDRGLLLREGGGWRVRQPLPLDLLPSGVQSVLRARIDALSLEAKAVLRDAAVVAVAFRPELLVGLASAEEVHRGLAQLSDRGILTQDDAGERYRFGHELIRDVAYLAIPKRERALRHATLASWATKMPEVAEPHPEELVADQARQAFALGEEMGLLDLPQLRDARVAGARACGALGRAALDEAEPARAELLFGEALAFSDADGVAPLLAVDELDRLRLGRAAALVSLHRVDAAETALTGLLDSADLRLRASALVIAGQVHRQRGEEAAALAALVQAVALASEQGADRTTSEALRQLGLVHYLAGRLRKAEESFLQARALAERVGDLRGLGWALQHLTWSATTRGAYREAEDGLRLAAEVFGRLDDQAGLAWSAGTEAFLRLLQGRLSEARALAQSLLPLGEAMGQRWGTAVCLTIDAFAAAELGELRLALEEAAVAEARFIELGDAWGHSMALIARGLAERGRGDPSAAVALLQAAAKLSAEEGFPASGALALAALGYCELDRGRPHAARSAAVRALELLAPLDLEPAAKVGVEVLLAQACRGMGDLQQALSLLAAATAIGDEPSLIFPRRQALAHLAGALNDAGEHDRALVTAGQALRVPAEDVRSRVVALRVLAQCLSSVGDAPAARFALRQAYALACATEQVSERQATRAALRALDRG